MQLHIVVASVSFQCQRSTLVYTKTKIGSHLWRVLLNGLYQVQRKCLKLLKKERQIDTLLSQVSVTLMLPYFTERLMWHGVMFQLSLCSTSILFSKMIVCEGWYLSQFRKMMVGLNKCTVFLSIISVLNYLMLHKFVVSSKTWKQ
jgi:hypothetical protein